MFISKKYQSTRVRRVHLHDSQHFTIEQMVSFCIIDKDVEPKPTRYCKPVSAIAHTLFASAETNLSVPRSFYARQRLSIRSL